LRGATNDKGGWLTFGCEQDCFGSAEWTQLLVPVLHLDHASDAKRVSAIQADGQPADGEA